MRNFTVSGLFIAFLVACQSPGHSGKKGNQLVPQMEPDVSRSTTSPAPGTSVTPVPSTQSSVPRIGELPKASVGEGDPRTNPNLPFGIPTQVSGEDSVLILRPQYVLSWNSKTMNIDWAAWTLDTEQLKISGCSAATFSPDPLLKDYLAEHGLAAITHYDYSNSCFDRGHQVASGDRQGSVEDNLTTYFTSNIIPQTAFLNQVIWVLFENKIRDWIETNTYKHLWILSGPIYGETYAYTGRNKNIAIPKANFKAVFAWDESKKDKPLLVQAVIMPNVTSNGSDPAVAVDILCNEQKAGGHSGDDPTVARDIDAYGSSIEAIESVSRVIFPDAVRP